ncbi:MAG: NAD-glutamate dehydrogenase [Zetaproteobacteria bacterium CG1_02_53_45]|nr:MAG: NAD-glutamate dehydrogenase [Zetaproteobacteria bacterium CG1_02_53_45]
MRHLRHQLIELLDLARQQHRMEVVPPRLMAVLVQDFLKLLPKGKKLPLDMRWRTLTHGNLHRHIITICCPDQAFYLDAIRGYFLRSGIQPIGQQTMVAKMECGPDGCRLELRKPDLRDEANFMFIALHISATITPAPEQLTRDIFATLQAVDLSVQDFKPMRRFIAQSVAELIPDNSDAAALLDWMNDNHFLYFGIQSGNKRLGLARNKRVMARIAPQLAEQINSTPSAIEIGLSWVNLSASKSYLYSIASVEVVRICRHNRQGEIEIANIIGHFSRSARFANASYLPVIAAQWRKLAGDDLLQHSAFYRREIRTLFDRMPKRILLATGPLNWLEPMKAIVDLAGPLQLVASLIPSLQGNQDTLLIAITAKRFGPGVLKHIQQTLGEAGQIIHGCDSFGIGQHRIILIGIDRASPAIEQSELDALIRHCIIFWKDLAREELLRHAHLFDIPATLIELESISPLYQELFTPAQFTRDLQMRQRVLKSGLTRVYVSLKAKATGDEVELHIYSLNQPSLGDLVDIIRAFGLDPVQEAVIPFGKDPEASETSECSAGCIHISALTCRAPRHLDTEDVTRLKHGLMQVLNNQTDHDQLNALLVCAGLDIDEVAVLITLRNHLIQLMPDAAHRPLSNMMLRHPKASAALYQLFAARHHLMAMPDTFMSEASERFLEAMTRVESLADDRWFRALAELAESSLRTNAFIRKRGSPIGIKIDPGRLSFTPSPSPYREIFVHGVNVEGIHLRAGPIARGGLRYSDRPADFRTEVLELMSTQVVKNGQIIPTGSKGGFVIRDGEGPAFVLKQYRAFIRTLLVLTDNRVNAEIIPPAGMRIAESDKNDPYLVVAADKGTARFSDDANEESENAGFWLGDAFASGGRFGYDHKVVGITARGAWVCAAHHFAKSGIDAYSDPLSCVAIGDMGGDVFGNGMLLNPALQLLAAFNHRHIFLDPEPDPAKSFAERKRLFDAVSGWEGYDNTIISNGGGIFERSAKRIALSPSIRKALGIDAEELSGEALIRAILIAPVDLLYNGGIGTYVKAGNETHSEVRDPANNAVRVNAGQLRCKVVSEGGNLGFTQAARIEFSLAGGLINTDAMDNSAGVDMSDHEVNLKILFASNPDKTPTLAKRNQLLKSLTDEVTELCLADNRLQSRVLTLAELAVRQNLPRLQRLRDVLHEQGWLDESVAPRMLENELLRLRPQLSILLGQEKNRIHDQLVKQNFDRRSAFGEKLLTEYFPASLHSSHGSTYRTHPLANEIICTQAANYAVNLFGMTAVHHLQSMLDVDLSDIIEALLIAEAVTGSSDLREAIWNSNSDMEIILDLQRTLQEKLLCFAEELLRLCPVGHLDADWIARQQKGLRQFRRDISNMRLGKLAGSTHPELMDSISISGLDKEHALHMAAMPALSQSACALHLATLTELPLKQCLQANQACLELLPIEHFEAELRSADWGDSDAHLLRREWLHRLSKLKTRAITQLLVQPDKHFLQAGEKLWPEHRLWPQIKPFLSSHREGGELPQKQGEPRRAESRRMQLLLALTRLEAIVENS